MRQHDKLIHTAAKKVLAPHGLFRQGTSRTWLDDNGYFITFVVFEPISVMQGSRLGVGINFLWEKTEGLNEILSFSYGGQETGYFEYKENDETFQAKMEEFAEIGLQKVIEYRNFKDLDYARNRLEQEVSDTQENRRFWEVYDLAMICFLMGDFENGVKNFAYFLEILQHNFSIEWHEQFYNHCSTQIKPYLTSRETAQKVVLDMIKRRRDFFSSKTSFKKMNKELMFKPNNI